jgi:3-hydroxy-9,10-secoandrosta-1,3,5(10)-triene-9,17-dione monooxygenase
MTATVEKQIRIAAELVPLLRERAAKAEELRRIPDETVQDLIDTGLIRVPSPVRFGGSGLDYDAALEVGRELGRGCGSTAWCYAVWASHNWEIGLYPEQGQADYFGDGLDVFSSSGLNPRGGRAEKADGGYIVSGHWDFSSGCDASTWTLISAKTPDRGVASFLVPRGEWQIRDTWFVSGLAGTGSKDITVDGAFVPEHRILFQSDLVNATAPGRDLHDRASYRVPGYSIQGFTVCYPLLGMAQGAVEAFEERARGQAAAMTGENLAAAVPMHLRLAESSAEVDAGIAIARRSVSEILAAGAAGVTLSVDDRARYVRDRAFAVKLCLSAVNRLFEASGAHSLYQSAPLQRFFRDLHAGSHSIGVVWDMYAEQYGRIRMGLEPSVPFL